MYLRKGGLPWPFILKDLCACSSSYFFLRPTNFPLTKTIFEFFTPFTLLIWHLTNRTLTPYVYLFFSGMICIKLSHCVYENLWIRMLPLVDLALKYVTPNRIFSIFVSLLTSIALMRSRSLRNCAFSARTKWISS